MNVNSPFGSLFQIIVAPKKPDHVCSALVTACIWVANKRNHHHVLKLSRFLLAFGVGVTNFWWVYSQIAWKTDKLRSLLGLWVVNSPFLWLRPWPLDIFDSIWLHHYYFHSFDCILFLMWQPVHILFFFLLVIIILNSSIIFFFI